MYESRLNPNNICEGLEWDPSKRNMYPDLYKGTRPL